MDQKFCNIKEVFTHPFSATGFFLIETNTQQIIFLWNIGKILRFPLNGRTFLPNQKFRSLNITHKFQIGFWFRIESLLISDRLVELLYVCHFFWANSLLLIKNPNIPKHFRWIVESFGRFSKMITSVEIKRIMFSDTQCMTAPKQLSQPDGTSENHLINKCWLTWWL